MEQLPETSLFLLATRLLRFAVEFLPLLLLALTPAVARVVLDAVTSLECLLRRIASAVGGGDKIWLSAADTAAAVDGRR